VRIGVVLLLAIALATACGGENPAVETAPTPAERATPARLPNLGCDVQAQCFPQLAQQALDRCPASRLSRDGRLVRRRLERLLAQVAYVDLHNARAYQTTNALVAALEELERACLSSG
jgi:hypothetical protein